MPSSTNGGMAPRGCIWELVVLGPWECHYFGVSGWPSYRWLLHSTEYEPSHSQLITMLQGHSWSLQVYMSGLCQITDPPNDAVHPRNNISGRNIWAYRTTYNYRHVSTLWAYRNNWERLSLSRQLKTLHRSCAICSPKLLQIFSTPRLSITPSWYYQRPRLVFSFRGS